jgi:hypothetical protein
MSFEDWMREVNLMLRRLCGMDSNMLPDYAYYDAYKARKPPERVAKAAIKAARDY